MVGQAGGGLLRQIGAAHISSCLIEYTMLVIFYNIVMPVVMMGD